ncbi:MAG: exonuclease SbcCD subunit D [Proteobacteria bacterium]|nr:exonuclease SbcCD subunit D [Pseudomonadota bacterium]
MKFVHTADSHLGFEVVKTAPSPGKGRQRRAEWIFRNFVTVVDHAMEIEADLFIHSGDLFNKYYIPRERLDDLIKPLLDLERAGIPVLIIPGNHERSQFPFDLFHGAKGVFVFDRPKSISLTLDGYSVGVAGFPFIREDSKRTFLKALHETAYEEMRSDLNILVTHQAFDGATVGPGDYTFRPSRSDTVSRGTLPDDFSYIAAGHIHRYQILNHPSKPGLPLVYPGSIQRISFAEMDEEKGFVEAELLHGRIETRFIPLPAWDMEMVEIEAAGRTSEDVEEAIRAQFWRFGEEMVIRFNLTGGERTSDYPDIDLEKMRAEMPPVLECQFAVRVGKRWIKR